jgi:hypothetical protein
MSATVPAQLLQDIATRVHASIVDVKEPDLVHCPADKGVSRCPWCYRTFPEG